MYDVIWDSKSLQKFAEKTSWRSQNVIQKQHSPRQASVTALLQTVCVACTWIDNDEVYLEKRLEFTSGETLDNTQFWYENMPIIIYTFVPCNLCLIP